VSDQSPRDETSPTDSDERGSDDVSIRLASLTAPRTPVASVWQRREAAPAVPPQPVEPSAPRPPATAGIGRLTRIDAADLWTDASEMSTWVAANPEAMAELSALDGLRFHATNAGSLTGVTSDGAVVSIVCEVGPSSDAGLGTVLRTAAVQDGGTVMWVNGGPSDSHVAAVSWLNGATPPRFLLVKATGVRIDGSASAPMFEVLVRPARSTEAPDEGNDAPQRRVEDHLPES
jgi:hypothetical protein